eukprot:2351717-Rhodomonas_salina.1
MSGVLKQPYCALFQHNRVSPSVLKCHSYWYRATACAVLSWRVGVPGAGPRAAQHVAGLLPAYARPTRCPVLRSRMGLAGLYEYRGGCAETAHVQG